MSWSDFYQEQLDLLHESGLFRRLRWTEERRRMFFLLCAFHWAMSRFHVNFQERD